MKKINVFLIILMFVLLVFTSCCCGKSKIVVNKPIGEGILTSYSHSSDLDGSVDRDYGVVVLNGQLYNIGILNRWFSDWSYLNNYIGQYCYLYIEGSCAYSTWRLDNVKPEWWDSNYEQGKYNYGHQ